MVVPRLAAATILRRCWGTWKAPIVPNQMSGQYDRVYPMASLMLRGTVVVATLLWLAGVSPDVYAEVLDHAIPSGRALSDFNSQPDEPYYSSGGSASDPVCHHNVHRPCSRVPQPTFLGDVRWPAEAWPGLRPLSCRGWYVACYVREPPKHPPRVFTV
jgi:hypothetical protein